MWVPASMSSTPPAFVYRLSTRCSSAIEAPTDLTSERQCLGRYNRLSSVAKHCCAPSPAKTFRPHRPPPTLAQKVWADRSRAPGAASRTAAASIAGMEKMTTSRSCARKAAAIRTRPGVASATKAASDAKGAYPTTRQRAKQRSDRYCTDLIHMNSRLAVTSCVDAECVRMAFISNQRIHPTVCPSSRCSFF